MIYFIDEIPISERRLFIRVDFNVPLTAKGAIADDSRIRACIPTILYCLEKKAKPVIASHLGRPQGVRDPKYSLKPVADRLSELLPDVEVIFTEDCVGDGVRRLTHEIRPSQLMLLENLRFHRGEGENDERFSKRLAELCDIYVNDAFGASHRAHSSTAGMARLVEKRCGGFLLKKEIQFLSKVTEAPERPFVAILGGAKISDKIGVIENLLNRVDKLLIGGAMAYTFLACKSVPLGKSLIEQARIHAAKRALERAATKGIPILLPIDHVIAKECDPRSPAKTTDHQEIPDGWMGLDIGPKTLQFFAENLKGAKTIFWNGPLGVYEQGAFAQGTLNLARVIVDIPGAITIVGGGDSTSAVLQAGVADRITHISTGGGASLEFVEGKSLPGLKALES